MVSTRSKMGQLVQTIHVELRTPCLKLVNVHQRFYNTLTSNCTTLMFDMVGIIHPGLPMDLRVMFPGFPISIQWLAVP